MRGRSVRIDEERSRGQVTERALWMRGESVGEGRADEGGGVDVAWHAHGGDRFTMGFIDVCVQDARDMEVEERVGRMVELEPHDGGRYMLLSNALAAAGRWDDARIMSGNGGSRGEERGR
ncbi:hypothetical protein QJS10_CPA09g00923 [Acorus calamus]|uniref:Uncharacterized protein n=1 Tax=Acorus calamus TaxID=4465 RepID=A0AAV9E655_ACOCL|nr:hypothetical protein QJS10_CPA09g00923 [Acorus calamus]